MLDLRAIRDDPEPARRALARRGAVEQLDRALALDERRRDLVQRVEALRAEQNRGSKEVASAQGEDRQRRIEQLRRVSDELKSLEPGLAEAEAELEEVAARLPNLPDPDAPDGLTDEDNVEVSRWGEARAFDF